MHFGMAQYVDERRSLDLGRCQSGLSLEFAYTQMSIFYFLIILVHLQCIDVKIGRVNDWPSSATLWSKLH